MIANAGMVLGIIWAVATILLVAFAFTPRRQTAALAATDKEPGGKADCSRMIPSCALHGAVIPCMLKSSTVYEKDLN